MRLSIKLTDIYGISRRNAKKYISDGRVCINDKIVRKDVEIRELDEIRLNIVPVSPSVQAEELVIARKDGIIFFYKPPFMHSERHTPEDPLTIEDLVPSAYRLISRLDHETDGILAAVEQGYEVKTLHKVYIAAVEGDFYEYLFMDNKIDAAKRKKVKVYEETGGNAVKFSLREKYGTISIVEASLEKANRHQLRAFLAHKGFPILGDKLYGGKSFPRLMLHCEQTEINGLKEYSHRSQAFISYLKANI